VVQTTYCLSTLSTVEASWFCGWRKSFNKIIHLERIPSSFKEAVIVPVYKGKGRDSLLANNYRGISLSSVIDLWACHPSQNDSNPGREGDPASHTDSIPGWCIVLWRNRSCTRGEKPVSTVVPMLLQPRISIWLCRALRTPQPTVQCRHQWESLPSDQWSSRCLFSTWLNLLSKLSTEPPSQTAVCLNSTPISVSYWLPPCGIWLFWDGSINGIYLGSLGHSDDLEA
jgi:hypothetical protein